MLLPSQGCHFLRVIVLTTCVLLALTTAWFIGAQVLPQGLAEHHKATIRRDLLDDISNARLGVSSLISSLFTTFCLQLNTIEQYQKIFVISLASRTDHRDSMSLAAALAGLEVEYVDGVTSLENKTLPPGGLERGVNIGSLYGWRAHMNVLRL